MPAKQIGVRIIWQLITAEEIDKALAGSPEGEVRRSRIDGLAGWIRSQPGDAQVVIRSVVESTHHEGRGTQVEANLLLAP